ncbi:MAG: DUF2281 domain-containing protein [Oscillospiraceae bacterium]|nr:DUF2281 domain-containing protein [Oscillospiraceae bacterium]
MANKQALMNEIESLPANVIDEILHYVLFLKQLKSNTVSDITLASEHSLSKDWLLPEEDAAWQNL